MLFLFIVILYYIYYIILYYIILYYIILYYIILYYIILYYLFCDKARKEEKRARKKCRVNTSRRRVLLPNS